jgi:hypothetical protein
MRTNLTQCRLDYSNPSPDDIDKYGWAGPIKYIPRNRTTQISTYGCETLCGSSSDLYPWGQVSSTITTWVLPIVGILVQAPFNSNAFWETIFSLARWIGSPMASLSYILWNIKVSGKCALLVDLAAEYGDGSNNENFLSIRDSFYLLMTMNQYTMKEHVLQKKEAEGLLRFALFSKDLRLLKPGVVPISEIYRAYLRRAEHSPQVPLAEPGQVPIGPPRPEEDLESVDKLNQLRQSLASGLRAKRRRGVVPVFISTLWFVFSLGLSIQAAFGFLGENAQAHDLALGLLLAWLPVLILSSIVDRNPVASNDILIKLNALIDRVRMSLMDDTVKQDYLRTIADVNHQTRMTGRVEATSRACPDLENFFVKFAGQGRKPDLDGHRAGIYCRKGTQLATRKRGGSKNESRPGRRVRWARLVGSSRAVASAQRDRYRRRDYPRSLLSLVLHPNSRSRLPFRRVHGLWQCIVRSSSRRDGTLVGL